MSFTKRLEEAQRAAQVNAVGGQEAYKAHMKKRSRNNAIAKGLAVIAAMSIGVAIYCGVAWLVRLSWNAVAVDLGAPSLGYDGALGIVGLLAVASMFFRRSKA